MLIKLIENRSEIGAGTRGSSLGIDALRMASLDKGNTFFTKHDIETIKDENHLLFEEIKYPRAKRIEGILNIFQNISECVKATMLDNKFPLILAGDHSSAGGTIAGIKAAHPSKRLGVIWVDAHADLHSPYTSPSGNVHGMPLASALGEDNMSCATNDVSSKVADYWNRLKNMQGIATKVKGQDIVFYGVRDTEAQEDAIIEREGIKNFTVEECREKGIEAVCIEGLNQLKDCDIIYLSFDVDSMDCDVVSKGTGTPVPNGFRPEEAKEILQRLAKSNKLVCFEMVEVNPLLDNKQNRMAEVSFDILENTYTTIVESKQTLVHEPS